MSQTLRKAFHILVSRLRQQGLRTTLLWAYGRGIPRITGIPMREYSQITPNIFVGPQFNARGRAVLREWGVNGTINLREEYDDDAHGLTLAHHLYLPTQDDAALSWDSMERGCEFIQQVLGAGGKVYIHCAGGVGRAPSMAAAYFIRQGMSLDEALRLIRTTRPFINITPPQQDRLLEWQHKYHAETS